LRGALAQRRSRGGAERAPGGLVSFRRGLQTLPAAFAQALGERFRARTSVEAIVPEGGGWRVRSAREAHRAGAVLRALPAAAAARDLREQGLVRGEPRILRLTRWPRAIPQYERGHAERIEALERVEARWPGLAFAGNYREGVSVADSLRSGLSAAARLQRVGPSEPNA